MPSDKPRGREMCRADWYDYEKVATGLEAQAANLIEAARTIRSLAPVPDFCEIKLMGWPKPISGAAPDRPKPNER